MFGLTLGKLLILAVCAWFGWNLFKALGAPSKPGARPPPPRQDAPSQRGNPALQAEDMVRCAVCGTYFAAQGAVSCGKTNCPAGR